MISIMNRIAQMMESMVAMQEAIITLCITDDTIEYKQKLHSCVQKIKNTMSQKTNSSNETEKDNKRKIQKVDVTTSDKDSEHEQMEEEEDEANEK